MVNPQEIPEGKHSPNNRTGQNTVFYILGIAVLVLLFLAARLFSFLLFHSLAELFSVALGFSLFVLVWNARKFTNNYLFILGAGFGAAGILDLFHTLAYEGINIFQGYDANLPAQLWIAARYLQSISMFAATFFIQNSPDHNAQPQAKPGAVRSNRFYILVCAVHFLLVTILLAAIFSHRFPVCFIEGQGLTPFKKISELIICSFLAAALAGLWRKRSLFERRTINLLMAAVAATILSELAFIFYVNLQDVFIVLGHFAKIVAYSLIYFIIIQDGMQNPYGILLGSLQKQRDHLAQMEYQLDAALTNLRLVSENSRDVIWILDIASQKYTYVSPSVFQLRGFSPDEVMQQPLQETLTPESLKMVAEVLPLNLQKFIETGSSPTQTYEIFQPHKDGHIVPTEVITTYVKTADGRIQIVGISRDITDRKNADELHTKTQVMLEIAQSIARMGSWEKDYQSGLSSWSKEMYRLFHFDPAQGVPRFTEFLNRIHPDDREHLLETEKQIIASGQAGTYHVRIVLDQNAVHHFEFLLQPFKNEQGELHKLVGVVMDITERHKAQELLEQNQARFNRAEKMAQIGSWELDLVNNSLIWSDQVYEIFGMQPQAFPATYEAFLDAIHPDDREQVNAAYANSLQTRQPYKISHRLLLNGTQVKYVLEQCETIFDPEGRALRSIGTVQDITERVETDHLLNAEQAKLRSVNERFEQLAGSIQEVFWLVDLVNQKIAYISPAYEVIWGRTCESLYANPNQYLECILPEDRDIMLSARIEQSQGHATKMEYRIVRPDGALRWILDRSFPVYDEDGNLVRTAGVASDNTENKLAQLELSASEEKYRQLSLELEKRVVERTAEVQDLYDNAPTGYHSEDAFGNFRLINQTELDWLGYTREEMVGRMNVAQILTPQGYRDYLAQIRLAASEGAIKDFEIDFVRKDGSRMPVILNAVAVVDPNRQYSANRVTVFDNTARKKAQDALLESERSLRRSRDELSAANAALAKAARLKDEFMASMSHELRTPLTGILGLTEVLQTGIYGQLTEKQAKAMENIDGSGRHLLELINEILDLSKIEAEMLVLNIERVSIAEICQSSLHITRGLAQQKRIQMSYATNLSSLATISVDARRLKQMLVNLLSNAVKFTPEGGSAGIEVAGDEKNKIVQLTVWDTGIGIRNEDMARLFKPFVQLDSSLSRQYSGTGLGLALVARLAEMHGGSVSVTSAAGQGSRFTIKLPWVGSEPALPDSSTVIEPGPQAAGAGLRVLLVDDNEVILESVSDYLSAKAIQVVTARDGKEMVRLAQTAAPNVIIADIQMPGFDGLSAIRAVRALPDPVIAKVPIIALTALAMPGDEEKCLEAGANVYASKPVSLVKILSLVRSLVA